MAAEHDATVTGREKELKQLSQCETHSFGHLRWRRRADIFAHSAVFRQRFEAAKARRFGSFGGHQPREEISISAALGRTCPVGLTHYGCYEYGFTAGDDVFTKMKNLISNPIET